MEDDGTLDAISLKVPLMPKEEPSSSSSTIWKLMTSVVLMSWLLGFRDEIEDDLDLKLSKSSQFFISVEKAKVITPLFNSSHAKFKVLPEDSGSSRDGGQNVLRVSGSTSRSADSSTDGGNRGTAQSSGDGQSGGDGGDGDRGGGFRLLLGFIGYLNVRLILVLVDIVLRHPDREKLMTLIKEDPNEALNLVGHMISTTHLQEYCYAGRFQEFVEDFRSGPCWQTILKAVIFAILGRPRMGR